MIILAPSRIPEAANIQIAGKLFNALSFVTYYERASITYIYILTRSSVKRHRCDKSIFPPGQKNTESVTAFALS